MQILSPRAIDATVTEPLLCGRPAATGGSFAAAAPAAPRPGGAAGAQEASQPTCAPHSDLHFRRNFTALIQLLRPYPALLLSLLSVGEAFVVAEVGKVAGSFYRIILDRQAAQLAAVLLHAGALYGASTALYAAASWVTGTLALRWRQRLTRHLHRRYCRGAGFYALQRLVGQQQAQQQAEAEERVQLGEALGGSPGAEQPHGQQGEQQQERQRQQEGPSTDNPDQRIAADAAAMCDCLSVVARVAAAAPFKLMYYSWLTQGYLGWQGLAAVYAFFWVAALVQRLAVAPVSRLVFRQERREGDLRFAHLRLREYAAEVAQYGGAPAERRHLDATLDAALGNQSRLVTWRALLAASTRAVDYAGAMLNYVVVGAAVFAGMAGVGEGGEAAQFVSNASFATLSLIYTVTELLDLSDQISQLGGLTARVGELLDALPADPAAAESGGRGGGGRGKHGPGRFGASSMGHAAVRPSIDGRELQPSHFATLLQGPRMLSCLDGTVALEASVHLLGPDLQHEARAIFPDAPPTGPLLACITFQFAAGGISLAPDSSAATLERSAAEMDRMLDAFLRWEAALREALAEAGCWCDAVDPRSGMALHGSRGARWSEVAAAHALLGYERRDAGICPVVLHPLHGTSAYPATLFTDAPPAVLEAALAAVSSSPSLPPPLPESAPSRGGGGMGSAEGEPLLRLQGMTLRTPAGRLAVEGLSLQLRREQHLLIAGPNGCGKSTLVKALCGLHPTEAGHVQLAPAGRGNASVGISLVATASAGAGGVGCASSGCSGVMFVPQRPLAAPGGALWQQICYPGGSGASSGCSAGPLAQQQRMQGVNLGRGMEEEEEEEGAPERPPDGQLLALLQRVGLQYLLDRVGGSFEAAADWGAMLSPGELQRLSVARVLHRRPALAVLDEVTSAVSEEAAQRLYGEMHADGITCVSIGQDCRHLRRLHTLLLELGCGPHTGAWQLRELVTNIED